MRSNNLSVFLSVIVGKENDQRQPSLFPLPLLGLRPEGVEVRRRPGSAPDRRHHLGAQRVAQVGAEGSDHLLQLSEIGNG